MDTRESFINERCPQLKTLWEKYAKYERQFNTFSASSNYFDFCVDDPFISDTEDVIFQCYEEEVKIIYLFRDNKDTFREDHLMTHEQCLEYLDQLPKAWYHISKGITYTNEEN